MSFQDNLKYYREKAGYTTAKEFSEALGLSYTTYFAYENQGREPKYQLLCKISDLLDVSIDELLGHTAKQKTADDILEKRIKDILATSDNNNLFSFKGLDPVYIIFSLCNKGTLNIKRADVTNIIRKLNKNHEQQTNKDLYNVFAAFAVTTIIKQLNEELNALKTLEIKDETNRIDLITEKVNKIQEFQKIQDELTSERTRTIKYRFNFN